MDPNTQAVIDEMSRRIHSLLLENIVLTTQVNQLRAEMANMNGAPASEESSEDVK